MQKAILKKKKKTKHYEGCEDKYSKVKYQI